MDFNFFHLKILENQVKFNFFMMHSGYDTHKFLSDTIFSLKQKIGSIYIINTCDTIIDKINREGKHKILKTETAKRYNMYKESNVIFSLSSKVLLLDLITNKIQSNLIDYLIIGDLRVIEPDSKELFILKYLLNNETNIKFFIFNAYPSLFLNNFLILKRHLQLNTNDINNNNLKDLKMHMLSRNNRVLDKIINYALNIKGVTISEHNLIDHRTVELEKLLIYLYNHCLEEVIAKIFIPDVKLSEEKSKDDEYKKRCLDILKFENIINRNSHFLINTLNSSYSFPFKVKVLIKDLQVIVKFLTKLEYYDMPSLLYCFNKIIKSAEDDSIFNYKDCITLNLIENITSNLKHNIYKIKEIENEEKEFFDAEAYLAKNSLIEYNDFNLNIIKNYKVDYWTYIDFNINFKARKVVEILNLIKQKKEKKNILILTNNDYNSEILSDILASVYINKDGGVAFYEKKIRTMLFSKMEYLKRKKLIKYHENNPNHLSYIDSIIIQKLTYDLVSKSDLKYMEILESIIKTSNKEEETLSNEIEINSSDFYQFDETSFNVTNIIENCSIFILHFKENISFLEFLVNNDIDEVIFYSFDVNKLRYLESIISQREDIRVKHIHLINCINNINFKIDLQAINNEFKIFKKVYDELTFLDKLNLNKRKEAEEGLKLDNDNNTIESNLLTNNDSQIVKVKSEEKVNKNIVVDFREMSSQVPFYLYDFGFNIITGGLEIGDYITSNSVCIERKSITTGDLFESLKTSRLTNQIIKMQKYFDNIIILLEFEGELANLISVNNKHFYKLKFMYKNFIEIKAYSNKIHFIWSYNPKMTAAILFLIKTHFNDTLDIKRCLNINKKDNNNNNLSLESKKSNSQHSIFSFYKSNLLFNNDNNNENENAEENKESRRLSQFVNELEKRYENDEDESKNDNRKMEICIEKFLHRVDGITKENINLVFKNFKNLKEFILTQKDKLISIFGKNSGTKIFFYLTTKHYLNEQNL